MNFFFLSLHGTCAWVKKFCRVLVSQDRATRSFLPSQPREKFLPARGFILDQKSPILDRFLTPRNLRDIALFFLRMTWILLSFFKKNSIFCILNQSEELFAKIILLLRNSIFRSRSMISIWSNPIEIITISCRSIEKNIRKISQGC